MLLLVAETKERLRATGKPAVQNNPEYGS